MYQYRRSRFEEPPDQPPPVSYRAPSSFQVPPPSLPTCGPQETFGTSGLQVVEGRCLKKKKKGAMWEPEAGLDPGPVGVSSTMSLQGCPPARNLFSSTHTPQQTAVETWHAAARKK